MANSHKAPKQWCLSKNETVNSFENWRQNLLYSLSLDTNFAPFLVAGRTWGKRSRNSPRRGFTDDGNSIPKASRRTADQKVTMLELMLGQIANYCPIISRNSIVKNSTSIEYIWQLIRLHYGFQSTGAHFIDFNDIHLESDEKAEDLYQRLSAFVEDNLLRQGGNITHHGVDVTEDEEASPTLENLVVLSWLRLIHHDLPKLVKQRYGTELRTRTLASIKPEISQALESLLLEIHTSEDVRTMRTSTGNQFLFSRGNPKASNGRTTTKPNRATKVCPICQQAKRPYFNNFLSECRFLPDQDRKFLATARQITKVVDYTSEFPQEENTGPSHSEPATTLRVQVRQSPYLNAFKRI
ncbi:hypothetical protein LOTGIDRAFT_170991 [Lottia gigantea]|uniref:Uncharacterized protein n=1 Tax=Lottia gigantea TaxID=225164 RepID=V4AJ26_LOTGI|nr:hypothetical protein LOTGIDRAFT_170991 [Lottia gigantea]ESP04159.1 hypothetical protein LOTGIDRAFT_170991 [Lottia gigantea]